MSHCFDTNCPGAAKWQMGVHAWPAGANKDEDAPELIALAFFCCDEHRKHPPPASSLLHSEVMNLVQQGRVAQELPELDFAGAHVVFKPYLTNGGEWCR